jgi:putative transcriptional regulator
LLAEHNDEGSFGVIMNKPVTAKFNDVIKDFPKFDTSIFIGGPVETNKLFYIHTFGEDVQDAIEIADGVFWGGDIEVIKEMVFLGRANNQNISFFIGYSGWGANQLDSELKKNSWIITKADKDVFFNTHPAQMWDTLMRNMGGKYRYWTKFPSDPGLN